MPLTSPGFAGFVPNGNVWSFSFSLSSVCCARFVFLRVLPSLLPVGAFGGGGEMGCMVGVSVVDRGLAAAKWDAWDGMAPGGRQFDFGLARVVKRRNRVNARYEMTGETGSMRYMAPEVRKMLENYAELVCEILEYIKICLEM